MNSTNTLNASCARCHVASSAIAQPLRSCGGCGRVSYCSRNCQRRDWKGHKAECQSQQQQQEQGQASASSSTGRTRTTMRMSLADMMRMAKAFKDSEENTPPSAEEETDTIYYLKTSTPHLYDISMSGPYKMLPQLFLQAAHNFGPECRPGIDTLNDFVIDEEHFVPFQHISSPINGNPNLVRRVQLIRRTNAQIAEKLPCPVWNVVYAQPRLEGPQQVSLGIVPMRTLDILDSFESKNEANAAARQKMSELLVKEGQARHRSVEMPMPGGTFGGAIVVKDTLAIKWTIEVKKDSGGVEFYEQLETSRVSQ